MQIKWPFPTIIEKSHLITQRLKKSATTSLNFQKDTLVVIIILEVNPLTGL